jgi:hypothetical protein
MSEIFNLLAELDLETLACDPETLEGRARLREIDAHIFELECQLEEINTFERLHNGL